MWHKEDFKITKPEFFSKTYESFFRTWNEVLSTTVNLIKTSYIGTFWTIALGVYELLKSDFIQGTRKFGG